MKKHNKTNRQKGMHENVPKHFFDMRLCGREIQNRSAVIKRLSIVMGCIIAALIAYNLITYSVMARTSSYVMYDFKLRWQECAYTLRGVNPFDSIFGQVVIPDIGRIDTVAGTMPWAYTIGNAMVAGWLDYETAAAYYNILYILSGIVCFALLLKEYLKSIQSKSLGILIVFSIFAFWALTYAFLLGNYGTTCCFLTIISMMLSKKGKPAKFVAGILLAISLCKPQISGLVFLTYLLTGEYMIVGVSGLLVLIGYVSTASLTKTSVITLLTQIFEQGTGYDSELINDGIFTFLRGAGVPTSVILLLSMTAGLALFAYGFARIRRSDFGNDIFFLFTPASICSCIWFYHNPYDTIFLIIAILAVGILIERQRFTGGLVRLIIAWIILMAGYTICEIFGFALLNRTMSNGYIAHDLSVLMEDILYILVYLEIIWATGGKRGDT